MQLSNVQEISQPKEVLYGCFIWKTVLYRDKTRWAACINPCLGMPSVQVARGAAAVGTASWALGGSPGKKPRVTLCRTKGLGSHGPARALDAEMAGAKDPENFPSLDCKSRKAQGLLWFGCLLRDTRSSCYFAISLSSYWGKIKSSEGCGHLRLCCWKPDVSLSVGCV